MLSGNAHPPALQGRAYTAARQAPSRGLKNYPATPTCKPPSCHPARGCCSRRLGLWLLTADLRNGRADYTNRTDQEPPAKIREMAVKETLSGGGYRRKPKP